MPIEGVPREIIDIEVPKGLRSFRIKMSKGEILLKVRNFRKIPDRGQLGMKIELVTKEDWHRV